MTRKEILPGIFLNHVQDDKFKLASLSFTLLTQLKRETASMNALLPSVLCRGSRNYDTLDKLSCRFEELYGSSVSCMVKKYGEIQAFGIALSYPEAVFLPETPDSPVDFHYECVYAIRQTPLLSHLLPGAMQ